MVSSSASLLLCCFTITVANDVYKKYINEENGSNDCGNVIPELVLAVIKNEFKTKLTKIIFDDLYKADHSFKLYLDKILKSISNTAVIFGHKDQNIEVIHENEQPAWVIFSAQPERLTVKGKILLFVHVSPFQLKEWLSTSVTKNNQQLIAVSDPALKKYRGSQKDCDTGVYSQIINGDSYGGNKALILTSWRGHNFTQDIKIFHSADEIAYNGIHLVISANILPPFVFKRFAENGEILWEGVEVRLLHLIKEILNFTLEFREITDMDLRNGVLKDLEQGHADLGIGGLVVAKAMFPLSSFIYPHSMDCAAFISLTSIALPRYRAIMGPFLWDVWISITLCYVFAIIPIAFSAWHTLRPLLQNPAEFGNMFWYVFGTFTNCFTFHGRNSWTKSVKFSTKLFIGSYWVFTIIITACYTGSIIAFITLPVYPEVIDTMHQLLYNNYRITTMAKEGWWEVLTGTDDEVANGLAGTAQKVTSVLEGLSAVEASAKEDYPVAFLGSSELLMHIIKTNHTASQLGKRQLFHISKQCFVTQMISMLLPYDSIYVDAFNKAILKASEAGFIKKIYQDLEWDVHKSSERQTIFQGSLKLEALERQLTLDDTQGMFLLLGCGFIIALCVLFIELATWVKSRKGEKLMVLAKQRLLAISRTVSIAILAPSITHTREHYPLYFRQILRRGSSLFGSIVNLESIFSEGQTKPSTAISDTHLKPSAVEKPIRLLSF